MEVFSLDDHHQQAVRCWQVADGEQDLSMARRWLLEMEMKKGFILYTIMAINWNTIVLFRNAKCYEVMN